VDQISLDEFPHGLLLAGKTMSTKFIHLNDIFIQKHFENASGPSGVGQLSD
jgi:hypothetical protein